MKRVIVILVILLIAAGYVTAQFFFDDFESYNVGEQLAYKILKIGSPGAIHPVL